MVVECVDKQTKYGLIVFRYAFGDCRKPCPESVALVEDIVRQQMSNLVR